MTTASITQIVRQPASGGAIRLERVGHRFAGVGGPRNPHSLPSASTNDAATCRSETGRVIET